MFSRHLPRLSFTGRVQSEKEKSKEIGSIANFTPEGFFLKTSQKHSVGDTFDLFLNLPEYTRDIQIKVRVVWNGYKANASGIGLKISDISQDDLFVLRNYYLSQIQEKFLPYITPLLEVDQIQNIFPFTDYDLCYSFLKKIYNEQIKTTIISENLDWITQGVYEKIVNRNIYISIAETPSEDFKGKRIRVYLGTDNNLFYFYSQFINRIGNSIILSIPEQIFSIRRRRYHRAVQDPSWDMRVEIPLPYPPGMILKKEIIDISSNGLAFKIDPKESYFLPGTPLNDISIYRKQTKLLNTQAEVRHITPVKEKNNQEYLKVGIQFRIRSKRFLKGYLPSSNIIDEGSEKSAHLQHPATAKESHPSNLVINKYENSKVQMINMPVHAKKLEWKSKKIFYKNKRKEEIAVILNYTCNQSKEMPVILIPPAYGKRKESTSLFAFMFIQNFLLYGKDVAIVRFDGTHSIGESFKKIECRQVGRETLYMSLSHAVEDISTMIEFCYHNQYFVPKKLILCSPSLSAVAARRTIAIENKGLVHFWICPMGVPDPQSALKNVTGGIDYLGIIREGKKAGTASVLGLNVDWDHFWHDAENHALATMAHGLADMENIDIPVSWIYGSFDAWVTLNDVKSLLLRYTGLNAKIHEILTGHLPLNGREAIDLFSLIISEVWHFLFEEKIAIFKPDQDIMNHALSEEWYCSLKDTGNFGNNWSQCLIENVIDSFSNKTFINSKAYRELLNMEYDLLHLQDRQTLADIGCASFGLLESRAHELKSKNTKVSLVDMIDNGIVKKVKNELNHLQTHHGVDIQFLPFNLDFNPLTLIKQLCNHEIHDLDMFKGVIDGLTDYSVKLWERYSSDHLFQILQGKNLNLYDMEFLNNNFPRCEVQIICDINRAASYVQHHFNNQHDRTHQGEKLKTFHLKFRSHFNDFAFPFHSDSFDRIISTLICSYVKNPYVLLREVYRILKKDGQFVISILKSNVDMKNIYANLIERITEKNPEYLLFNIRKDDNLLVDFMNMNNATEMVPFFFGRKPLHFFDSQKVEKLFRHLQFKELEIHESFGEPPIAFVVRGVK